MKYKRQIWGGVGSNLNGAYLRIKKSGRDEESHIHPSSDGPPYSNSEGIGVY